MGGTEVFDTLGKCIEGQKGSSRTIITNLQGIKKSSKYVGLYGLLSRFTALAFVDAFVEVVHELATMFQSDKREDVTEQRDGGVDHCNSERKGTRNDVILQNFFKCSEIFFKDYT